MLWRYIEKKVKNSLYPDLYYWSPRLPRAIQKSIYKQYGLNIKFEFIPEHLSPFYYFLYFGKKKGYHYPTDDDIKFFYFTLFKKNGFIFLIFCCIVYRNCFLEFLTLVIKSGIAFYLIVYFIYMVLFIRKHIRMTVRLIYRTPSKLRPLLFVIGINQFLNIIFNFNSKKKKWYF